MPLPELERGKHDDRVLIARISSDNKRNQCTSAYGDEQARTARFVRGRLLNSALPPLGGRGSTGIELIRIQREAERGELKRTQATSARWLIAVAQSVGGRRATGFNGHVAMRRSRIEERVRNATHWPSIEYAKALTAVVKRVTLVVWKVHRLPRGLSRVAQRLRA